jgi:DNA segregation ATPase FtsK/SpoIIIE, S-DNA-T family
MIGAFDILGQSIAAFVEDRIGRSDLSAEEAPTIRLKGFLEGEIPSIVDALLANERLTLPEHDVPPTVVVGRRGTLEGVDQVHLLSDERTLTWYRNHNEHGLIIIELDAQSDAQGLNFIDTLADNDVLRDPDMRSHRLKTTTSLAWAGASETRSGVPDSVQSEIVALFDHLAAMSPPAIPSLRRWVEFVGVVVGILATTGRAVSGPEVRSVLCSQLQHLRMFPDDMLYERPTGVGRRLERNYHLAGLRSPQGRDVRIEDLESRIEEVELRAADGSPLPADALADVRSDMRRILGGGEVEAYSRVQLRLWEQLFERREPAVGLGEQIRDYLMDAHPARVAEYDGLGVEAGLDDGDSDAAESLLRADEGNAELPLVDVLRKDLRRRVERLVFAGEEESPDPLKTILFGVNAIDLGVASDSEKPREVVVLEWERLHDEGTLSARLFAFLYGPTLLGISEDSSSGLGLSLRVDPSLVTAGPLNADDFLADDEDADALSRAWTPLRLTLRIENGGTPLLRFRWSPAQLTGLVAFARVVAMGGVSAGGTISSLDAFTEGSLAVDEDLDFQPGPVAVGETSPAGRWRSTFGGHAKEWAATGISIEGLDDFLGWWEDLVAEAREELVPTGSSLPELDSLLGQDLVTTDSGTWVLLPTHPLRLRWIREHLANMRTWLVSALSGELILNTENDRLFFDWLGRVSPHRQPALISPESRVLAIAARESGWHEEFVDLEAARALDQDSIVDEASVEELVAVCRQFLHSYPHKTDAFSLLLLLRGHDTRTPSLVLKKLRQREFASLALTMHVVAPRQDHETIARSAREFDDADGRGQAMFPKVQLALHAWDRDVPGALDELEGRVDVALAPNLFGVETEALEDTRARSEGVAGHFDPWLDAATHVRSGSGVNVSQVMLPEVPDPVLEAWSTLTVRRYRRSVVKQDDPSSTDFVTLQVLFDANRKLFEKLHDVAHWVVTLDPFVGRDQIDALEGRPDIILVKEGVGKNETYTLVVSSSAGRPFVVERLRRRLVGDLAFASEHAEGVASQLFEAGRNVCPGLMLRALGLGRSTEEILGLISARFVCSSALEDTVDGVEFWVNLDEHAHWFGGPHRTRPDLLRASLIKSDQGVLLRLLVVESKFRKTLDLSIADQQLLAGVSLLKAAFVTGEAPAADARFWRRELQRAFRQLPRSGSAAGVLPAVRRLGHGMQDQEIDRLLLGGEYRCDGVDTLVVAAAWGQDVVDAPNATDAGNPLVAIGREGLRDLLTRLRNGEAPSVSLPSSSPTFTSLHAVDEDDSAQSQAAGSFAFPPAAAEPEAAYVTEVVNAGLGFEGREGQLQSILDRLDRLGVAVAAGDPAHTEGPRFAVYRVVPRADVPIERVVGRTQELKLALGLASDQFIRAFVDRGSVVFEVPKDDAHSFVISAESLWARFDDDPDALSVPIGVDIGNRIVDVDFSSAETPHLLIAGQTGSGKSVALETLLTGLCRQKTAEELRLHLVDPKGTELLDLTDDPHVDGEIGYLPEDAVQLLKAGVDEMERRYAIFKSHRSRSLPKFNAGVEAPDRLPWWLIVLDEYADLTSDSDDRKAIETNLRRIAQKGRASGIHLVVATQRPSADVIGTVIRSNLPAQLALRVKSPNTRRRTGWRRLRPCRG